MIVAFKWGDLKNWKLYYPTILYFAIGDLAYNFLTCNNPLWIYESPIFTHTFSDLLVLSIAFPSFVLVFLPHYPDGFMNQIIYIGICVFICSILEYISYSLGYFSYHNGWSIWWSAILYCIAFPLLILHYKKPLLVWPISIVLALGTLLLFDIPLKILK
ncbi:CBO0543 family protein [Anaeromicrobium sediminis]